MVFLVANTFTDSLARLTGDEQKAVKTTAFDRNRQRMLSTRQQIQIQVRDTTLKLKSPDKFGL